MTDRNATLLCWHAERAGIAVLENAVRALRNRKISVSHVLYLVQEGNVPALPAKVEEAVVTPIRLEIPDPTHHESIYAVIRERVLPLLRGVKGDLHLNVSPGTPAMHSVWLILHAGGALPLGTRLWSSQYSRETKRTRIDPVTFPVTTYLAEIRRLGRTQPEFAVYEPDALSASRKAAFERLARYALVPGAPLLLLGERGTGKTRLVETLVLQLKGVKNVTTVPCGGLDSTVVESTLFGHRKGAFTGALEDRPGLLASAKGGILFLDEVQDLPAGVQRKLVRVFQDRHRRYRPLGSDQEESVDVEIVCASNLALDQLRDRLDADLFDRLSHLMVCIPPLRECWEDLKEDWGRVWRELRQRDDLPEEPPWSSEIEDALMEHRLPGNLRDLQRLGLLLMAWWSDADIGGGIRSALSEWSGRTQMGPPMEDRFGSGTRTERIRAYRANLAKWAKAQYGTWAGAAEALGCDEKTLRQDADSAR